MKEYRTNENLIEYLLSKEVIISNKEDALMKIERYTYYSIVNTYKNIFKEVKIKQMIFTSFSFIGNILLTCCLLYFKYYIFSLLNFR